jgi:hypothetical protein
MTASISGPLPSIEFGTMLENIEVKHPKRHKQINRHYQDLLRLAKEYDSKLNVKASKRDVEEAKRLFDTIRARVIRLMGALRNTQDDIESSKLKSNPPVTDVIKAILYDHPELISETQQLLDKVNKKLSSWGYKKTKYDTVKSITSNLRRATKKR